MKTPTRIAAAGALALALAACGSKSKPDPYLQNLPEVAAITLDTTASAPAGIVVDPAPVTTAGDDLALVHRKAEAMNDALRAVFAHLEAITATGGHVLPGGVKEWGPADRCVEPDGAGGCVAGGVANLDLRVRLYTDHVADFVVRARPQGSTDANAFQPVLAGYLLRGAMDRRGAGKVWVNFPNLALAAPGFKGQGYLAAGFAAGPVAKAVTYRMLGFTRDPAAHPAITAAFNAWRNGAGIVRARVAGLDPDLYPGAADELGIWRAVWAPALGGRAFTVITNGDVTAGKYWFARACYPAGATLPSYKEWFECDKLVAGLPNSPAACVLAAPVVAGSHQGTVDPNVPTAFAHWSDTTCSWNPALHAGAAEPDELLPPSLEPRDVNDDRDEDGDHTGLLPEPCPTTVNVATPDPTPPGMVSGGLM